MLKILKYNDLYIILSLLFILIGGVFLFFIDQGDVVIALNRNHSPSLDFFFKYMTHVGDGMFIAIVIMGWMVKNRYQGLLFAVSTVLNALFIQYLKRGVFNAPRPLKYLGKEGYHFVEGVVVNTDFSFPSGHTNGAFAFLFSIAFFSRNRTVQVVCVILAMLTGVSRMYLFQHFLEDVVAGAGIAIVLNVLLYYIAIEKTPLGKKIIEA